MRAGPSSLQRGTHMGSPSAVTQHAAENDGWWSVVRRQRGGGGVSLRPTLCVPRSRDG
jgi:lipoate-protein ligase A